MREASPGQEPNPVVPHTVSGRPPLPHTLNPSRTFPTAPRASFTSLLTAATAPPPRQQANPRQPIGRLLPGRQLI